KLADHDGGFSRIEIKGDTLIVEFPVHTWAADENDHQEFSAERSEAKVSGILHTGFPIRRWDHDLGPGTQTLAVARLDEAVSEFPEVNDELSRPTGLDFRYLSLPSGRLVDWAVDDDARFVLVQLEKPIPGQLEASAIWRIDLDGEPELRRLTKPAADHGFGIEGTSPAGPRAPARRAQPWSAVSSSGPRRPTSPSNSWSSTSRRRPWNPSGPKPISGSVRSGPMIRLSWPVPTTTVAAASSSARSVMRDLGASSEARGRS